MSALTISDLSVHYGFGPNRFRALDGIELNVASGTFLTLLGPSGSGKTTLLRCVAGLNSPTSGRIEAGDRTFYDSRSGTGLPTRERNLGMVFQSFALWPHMLVADNVGFPLKMRGWAAARRRARVADLLERVGLPEHGARYPGQLSGGQQQRVGLARAIACEPSLLLMDEPLSSLDARLREEMRTYIRRLQTELGITVIYVTHDREEALGLSDVIVILSRGKVMSVGSPRQLFNDPPDAFTATFLAGWNQLGPLGTLIGTSDAAWVKELACLRESNAASSSILVMPTDFGDEGGIVFEAGPHVPATIAAVEFLGSAVRAELSLPGLARPVFISLRGEAAATALRMPKDAGVGIRRDAFRLLSGTAVHAPEALP